MKTDPERSDALSPAARKRLADVLLRHEHVVFAARPHAMVAIAAVVRAASCGAFAVVAAAATMAGIVAPLLGDAAIFTAGFMLPALSVRALGDVAYVRRYHAIITNRRTFILDGTHAHQLTTLDVAGGNAVTRSVAGRMFGFATIVTGGGAILRGLRKPEAFRRALEMPRVAFDERAAA